MSNSPDNPTPPSPQFPPPRALIEASGISVLDDDGNIVAVHERGEDGHMASFSRDNKLAATVVMIGDGNTVVSVEHGRKGRASLVINDGHILLTVFDDNGNVIRHADPFDIIGTLRDPLDCQRN